MNKPLLLIPTTLFWAACAASPATPAATAVCPEPSRAAPISKAAPPVDLESPRLDGDPVRVTYWVVADHADAGLGRAVPPELAAALAGSVSDPATLRLVDSGAIESMPELGARTHGSHSAFEQVVFRTADPVVVDLKIQTALRTSLESRVSLAPGVVTLVGSGAFRHEGRDDTEVVGEVFYMVKAEPATAPVTASRE